MRLWQASWDPTGAFVIWGEYMSSNPYAQFGMTHDDPAGEHPFACSAEQLADDLIKLELEPFSITFRQLLLPTLDNRPVLSPRLAPHPDGLQECRIRSWTVPAAVVQPVQALSFLTAIPGQLPEGLWLDDSFTFWREASKLLLEMLCRSRFLPALTRTGSGWSSRWSLLPPEGEDLSRLNTLIAGMPPLCSALCGKPNNLRPEPQQLLTSFFDRGCDALVRLFLSRFSFVQGMDQTKLVGRFGLQLEWLASLCRESGEIQGQEFELQRFAQRLESWGQRLLPRSSRQQYRVLFKLVPPAPAVAGEPRVWMVEILLQLADHADQYISAQSLWRPDAKAAGILNGERLAAEEALLSDLGRAVKVFPELLTALEQSQPTHVLLSTEQVYTFLRESVRLLEEHGFKVLLPPWWNDAPSHLGLALHVDSGPGSSDDLLSLESMFKCSWKILFGGKSLSVEEFDKLISASGPLIEIDGQWIELRPERVQAAREFLEQRSTDNKLRFVDVLRFGFGVENFENLPPVLEFTASGWIQQLLDASHQSLPVLNEPAGFEGQLRGYQKEGLSWLAFLSKVGVGACLADDMGLGKTVQLLALLLHERNCAEQTVAPTLLVVPMSTLENWEQETRRFSPQLKTYLHHGTLRLAGSEFINRAKSVDIVLTTYSIAFRDEMLLSEVSWGRIALDEAQNIKNVETKQTKSIRRLSRKGVNSAIPCHRVALTGTPLENHLDELWSIFDFLNPGFLGTVQEFRSQFMAPIERDRNEHAAAALSNLIRPFVLRRVKKDPKIISDLPEKIEIGERTVLTEEQAQLYRAVLEQMLPHVDSAHGIRRKGLVLSMITKLKQICNHPALFLRDRFPLQGRSGKLSRMEEILEVVLAEGDRVLIFTQYAQMGLLLQPYLQERFNRDVLFLHGGLSKTARDKLLERFRKTDGPSIFVLSLKAGGLGLNLTEANQVVHYDQWWNPAVQEQATDRAYRIGQKRNVQVRTLVCSGTLEERIQQMLEHKRNLADRIIETTRNVLTQMSTDELKRLLEFTGIGLSE